MNKLLIRWFINAVALATAAWLLPGIYVEDQPAWIAVAVMAIIFGLVNALVRPLLKLLTCPLILLTLGLFTLVINAGMLWLSSWIARQFDVQFYVDGFGPAFLGALVISVVSVVLSLVFHEEDREDRRSRR